MQTLPPSMMVRIATGKIIGLVFGLLTILVISLIWAEVPSSFLWGLMFWYITLGAFIGIFGVYTSHPVLDIPFPWYVRAPIIGAWGNLVVALIGYEPMSQFLIVAFGADAWLSNPLWFTVDGLAFGLLAGYCATSLGGEGPETVLKEINTLDAK